MKTFDNIRDFLQRQPKLFATLLLLNLTVVVNAVIYFDFHLTVIVVFLGSIVTQTVALGIILANRLPKFFTTLTLAVSSLWFLADCFVLCRYKYLVDSGIFQVLLDTNISEVSEYLYLQSKSSTLLMFFLVVAAVYLSFKVIIGLLPLLTRRRRLFNSVLLVCFASCVFTIPLVVFQFPASMSVFRIGYIVIKSLKETYEYQKIYEQYDNSAVRLTRNESALPWVIVVVGESTSRHHLSVYGYSLPTTPYMDNMKAEGELLVFDDIISPETTTMQVFERLFTFYRNDSGDSWYNYENLFDILNRAGYYTVWLSNQETSGIYGNVARAYAGRCNKKYFTVVRDSATRVNELDEKILPLLDNSLSENTSAKNFYILHLLGTHENYTDRYPKDYEVFKAESYQGDDEGQREMKAQYDNAVRYNDFVFAEIIRRFKLRDAIVIYLSDHGEEVYEDGVHRGHYSHGSMRQVEIPFVIWTSEAFRKNHAALYERLAAAQHLPFMTDDMIHAILDIMQIETEDYDAAKSLFSPVFNIDRERIYDGRIYLSHTQ